jgi:hypothetical protein
MFGAGKLRISNPAIFHESIPFSWLPPYNYGNDALA